MEIKRYKDFQLNEMKLDFLDNIYYLKEYPQCQAVPYNKSMKCDNCGYADFWKKHTYELIGFCYTNVGYMGVFECNSCGSIYKHHISSEKFSLEDFKEQAAMILYNKSRNPVIV